MLYSAFLRSLINFRLGKGRIAPEGDLLARSLLALDLRQGEPIIADRIADSTPTNRRAAAIRCLDWS